MKRISLALAAIGLSVTASAALPAATDPTVVNVPQLVGGFIVGATVDYFQTSNTHGDLDYATINNTSGNFFSSNIKNVDPGYDWAWGINAGYIFANTGNDVNVSYLEIDNTDFGDNLASNSLHGVGQTANIINFPFDIPTGGALSGASSNAGVRSEYNLYQADFTVGQYLNIGCRLRLHPFTGIRWAQLERRINSTYGQSQTYLLEESPSVVNTISNSQSATYAEKSDFRGLGPMVGFDTSYYIGRGIGVVGHFDAAALIGNTDASTDEVVFQNEFSHSPVGDENFTASASSSVSFKTSDNTCRIVPVLDAKLGADYTYLFHNSTISDHVSDLTLEAGWMVSNYFNVVDRLNTTTTTQNAFTGFSPPNPPLPPIIGVNITGRTTSDMEINGPYASLTLHA